MPFRIVDVGFYLTKNFFCYRIGNSLYSQDSEPTFYNGYLFNNRRKVGARQSTSYLPPTTGPINQAVEDYSAFSFTYNYPQEYQLGSHESTATETPTTSRTNSNLWSRSETKTLILSYQDHADALSKAKNPQAKKTIWEVIYAKFTKACEDYNITTGKSLGQLKEKWKTLFDKYKSINDNNKATGRGREKFEFFDAMDSFLGFSDKVNPRFVSETAIQRDISSGTESSPSPSASTSASCSSFETGPDSDAETSAPDPAKGKRKAAENKQGEDAVAIRKKRGEKRRKSDEHGSLITLLKSQQEMMMKAEEQDRLAMQQLMKFEVEAEKRHQEFTLAALKELGNIFKKD